MFRIIILAAASLLAGCVGQSSSPLIFGQGVTAGISVGTSAANGATPEIVVGLKQADIAIVPTVIPNDVQLPEGQESRNIRSHCEEKPGGGKDELPLQGKEDALSTFGSFSNTTQANCVSLGVFFATGVAAQNISEGFKESLKAGNKQEC